MLRQDMSQPQPTQARKEVSINDILKVIHSATAEDISLIKKAYEYTKEAHKDQKRLSGEPYINHLMETAFTLAELGTGAPTIAAGILHDTVEDTGKTLDEISKEFSPEVAILVDGVTKLGHLKYKGADRHNESLRKLFVAMSKDIRVLLIKLSDRLHNMKTLQHVPLEKQRRIAQETLEIYAPIAYRLGIRKFNRELEDLAFPYVYPTEYQEIKKVLKERRIDDRESLEKFSRSVRKELAKRGFVKIKTEYRIKGFYSLYKKYLRNNRELDNIYDINAMRVLVDTPEECYQVLGIIHSRWKPLPNRLKDYIAFPKLNGYQALHTTVFIGDGNIVEVQIKTHKMHMDSEYGIASHLSYKDQNTNAALAWVHALLPKKIQTELVSSNLDADTPEWIKELAEYEEPAQDLKKFRERLTSDFFSERIFAFSPKGDVVDLPKDSTPIDFAYAIHSGVGNKMTGAKVNGKLVSLDSALKNGDIVEIITKESGKPNRKWLDMAKTTMARRHIRHELGKNGL